MKNHRVRIALIAAGLLLVPFIGNLTSDQINWDLTDFIIAFILLYGMGLVIHLLWNRLRGSKLRYLLIVGLIVLFLLLWAELAVGLFGTPFSGD